MFCVAYSIYYLAYWLSNVVVRTNKNLLGVGAEWAGESCSAENKVVTDVDGEAG